jgi:hypothetical protein
MCLSLRTTKSAGMWFRLVAMLPHTARVLRVVGMAACKGLRIESRVPSAGSLRPVGQRPACEQDHTDA